MGLGRDGGGGGFLSSSETSFHSSLRIFKIENISIAMYALRKCGEPETSGGTQVNGWCEITAETALINQSSK